MYELTLTISERKAIDWVGYRYSHGDDLKDALMDGQMKSDDCNSDDIEWSGDYDITFVIPEHVAWNINDILDAPDGLCCFSRELQSKLIEFQMQIV